MIIKKSLESKFYIMFIIILLCGAFLRHYNYIQYPRHGATFDEFAWTWLGVNLIQKGTPISWSPQPQYNQRKEIRYQGAAFLIVKPYLEHPPLFGIVAGSFAIVRGAKDMYDVTLAKIRPLALLLGVLSICMVFLLSKEIYGIKTGLFASLLYATIPTITIGSRIVQNENFMIPFWLLSIYLIIKYLKTNKKRFRNLAIVIAGLLTLAKVPWLIVGVSLSLILSYKGKWKDALILGAGVLIIFLLFILYGVYYDKELFLNLWRLQVARYDIGFLGFFSVFTKPLLVDRYFVDGWIFFGWISIFFLSKDFKKHYILLIPFISYLLIYVFAIPDEPSHGWYRYPFYPFLIISSAVVLAEEYRNISLRTMFFLLLVGLSLLNNTWQIILGFSLLVYRLFIITAGVSVLLPLWFDKLNKKFFFVFWMIILILLNFVAVINYIE